MEDVPSKLVPGAGKDGVFETLYSQHHSAVLAYCARRASSADAWDAASETFLVAWRRIDEIPTGGREIAWLYGVAHRVLANQRRSTRRRRSLIERVAGSRDPDSWADEPLIRREEHDEVVQALIRLRPSDREIIHLALWEELAPVAIAEILGISRAAVDQRYSRAKRRLAKELDRTPSPRRNHRFTMNKGRTP
jgi:RNA polymerase sigma-70 factor (ECF subfamily)